MHLRNTFASLLFFSLAGCSNLLGGKCTFEVRNLVADGSVSDAGTVLASAQVLVSEQRGSRVSTSLQEVTLGTTLKGHVLSAAFKDAANPSVVRFNLPVAAAERFEISAGTVSTELGANLDGVRDLLIAGRGIIELHTDIPERPTVTISLVAGPPGDWSTPNCS
jgi:hypothetical protein